MKTIISHFAGFKAAGHNLLRWCLSHSKHPWRVIAIAVIAGAPLLQSLEADDIASEWLDRQFTDQATIDASIWLYDYQAKQQSITIDCVTNNLSGLTHNPVDNRWYAVTNSPEKLIEIDLSGQCLKEYPLPDHQDTEALVWIGERKLLLLEERRYRISEITLPASDDQPVLSAHKVTLDFLNLDNGKNKGLEGIAYRPFPLGRGWRQ